MVIAQVRKLEADILPLQESNTELSEKSGMLQAEKKLLEEDVKRWKSRTQVHLKMVVSRKASTIIAFLYKQKGLLLQDR